MDITGVNKVVNVSQLKQNAILQLSEKHNISSFAIFELADRPRNREKERVLTVLRKRIYYQVFEAQTPKEWATIGFFIGQNILHTFRKAGETDYQKQYTNDNGIFIRSFKYGELSYFEAYKDFSKKSLLFTLARKERDKSNFKDFCRLTQYITDKYDIHENLPPSVKETILLEVAAMAVDYGFRFNSNSFDLLARTAKRYSIESKYRDF